MSPKIYQCQVIGAGPAGISLLIAIYNQLSIASSEKSVRLEKLLESMVMLDAATAPGGVLGSYRINANTDAADVVSGIAPNTPFSALRDSYLKLAEVEQILISLSRVDALVIQPLARLTANLLGDRLLSATAVARIVKCDNLFKSFDKNGLLIATSRAVVMCTGGREKILDDLIPVKHKTVFAGDFLRLDDTYILEKLTSARTANIVVVGSSHSAFSCVWRLLHDPLFRGFIRHRKISILQRGRIVKLRCTPEFAGQHELPFDPVDDICPVTGLVYRHAGLRKDAKALYLRMKNGDERRADLLRIENLCDAQNLLDDAGLIIQCTGFVTNFPMVEIGGEPMYFKRRSQAGELRDAASNEVIPGLFANGLGNLILPEGKFRGEKSFNGSVDGMQSYPLAVAPRIIDLLLRIN